MEGARNIALRHFVKVNVDIFCCRGQKIGVINKYFVCNIKDC